MGDHEIPLLDSGADRDVPHRSAFHGRDANRVMTLPVEEETVHSVLRQPEGGNETYRGEVVGLGLARTQAKLHQ